METAMKNEPKIHFTRWRLGKLTYYGDEIVICPVCGRKGALSTRKSESNVYHVIEPTIIGDKLHDHCDLSTYTNEVTRADSEGNVVTKTTPYQRDIKSNTNGT
jgi:hypothetical protein